MVNTCCVPGCRSKPGQVLMHKFPSNKMQYAKWVNNINVLDIINESQEVVLRTKVVCHNHFRHETNIPMLKRHLRKNAVPTLFLPSKPVRKLGQGIYVCVQENERVVEDSSALDGHFAGNAQKNPEKTEEVHNLFEPTIKRKRLKDATISTVNLPVVPFKEQYYRIPRTVQKKPSTIDTHIDLLSNEYCAVKAKSSKYSTTQKNALKFRSIGIQTEPTNDLNVLSKEGDLRQVSLSKSVDFLQENLVGHVMKIKGNAFRIDELSIKCTRIDHDTQERETLVVRTDELISSSKDFLYHVLEDDRTREDNDSSTTLSAHEICENPNETVNFPNITRDCRVVLPRLPECVVEGAKKGYKLKVIKVKDTDDILRRNSIKNPENARFDYDDFMSDVRDLSIMSPDNYGINETDSSRNIKNLEGIECVEHSIIGKVSVRKKEDLFGNSMESKQDKQNNLKIPEVKLEEECLECSTAFQSMRELEDHLLDIHRIALKKDKYACEACPKKFITFKSLAYHNTTTHNAPAMDNVVIKVRCGMCRELFEPQYYRHGHSFLCKRKYEVEAEQKDKTLTDGIVKSFNEIMSKSTVIEPKSAESTGIMNKLRVLIGSNGGPNEITIVNLDE